MSCALSPSVARCYGLARVVEYLARSCYRALKETQPNTPPRRPGPVGACSDAELADHIRRQIAASRLHGEGYRKLWARPRRVRRVMRENGLLAPHRVGRTETKPHDGTMAAIDRRSCADISAPSAATAESKPVVAGQLGVLCLA